ncbi:MAG: hypothetical protein ACRDMX_09085 [Solirubrobacteraceae bacterium]
MPFVDLLRTTVLLSAGSASALGAVTLGTALSGGQDGVLAVAVGWWLAAALIGIWLGRRGDTSPPIATLLASARRRSSLPEVNPARTVLNRLWPLLVCTIGAGAIGAALPQVPAIAAGFAIIWALAWRRQPSAVTAIERRDGARFYVEPTSPLQAIALVRTPGLRTEATAHNGSQAPSESRRPA